MDNSITISNNQKQALAKTMTDLNYSATEIARTLNIHRATVYRYKDKPLSEDLRRFATEIKMMFILKQQQLLADILDKIEIKVKKGFPDLKSLLRAYEILKLHTPSLYEFYKQVKNDKKWDTAFALENHEEDLLE